MEIPKSVAHIRHNSWLSSDVRSQDKIIYQRYRYCGEDGQRPVHCRCTFEWNDNEDKLEFSKSFGTILYSIIFSFLKKFVRKVYPIVQH